MYGKPSHKVYEEFLKKFNACNEKSGKRQYVLPYFISSHPGSTLKDAVKLAEYIRDMGLFRSRPRILSHALYGFHLHVLYRKASLHRGKASYPQGNP